MNAASHPTDDELTLLAESAAEPRLAAMLRAHLAECSECTSTVAELKRALAPGYPAVVKGSDELAAGTTLGRFVVERRVGAGVSSTVYSAHDPVLSRTVALKVLRPTVSPGRAAQVLEEARRLARVHHPNVTAVFDVGTSGPLQWIAMEYLDGVSLRVHLRTHRASWDERFELFRAIAAGLSAAHAANVVQRDLKPENVMVTRAGRAVVTDFGLATSTDEVDLVRCALIGTPAYMSPEQLRGEPATSASDQFSFFVCLFEALFGERPFPGESVQALLGAVSAGPPLREPVVAPRAPADLDRLRQVMARGLSADASHRFSSMDEAWSALAPLYGPRGRSTTHLVLALGLSVAVGAGGVWWARSSVAPCEPARVVGPVWNAEVRGQLTTKFDGLRSPLAAEQASRVTKALDAYASAWAATYTHVCEGTSVRRDQSSELLDARMRCLDRRLTAVSALVTELERPDLVIALQATRAVASLERPESCLEATPSTQTALTPSVERAIAAAEASLLTGRFADAVSRAQALAATSPSPADAHRLEGRALAKLGRYPDAEQALVKAGGLALEQQRPTVFVQAMTNLAFLQATSLDRPREAARSVQLTRGALAALGNPAGLVAELDNAEAFVAVSEGRLDEARERLRHALEVRARLALPADPFVPGLRSNLAAVLEQSGALEDAVAAHDEAIRSWEALVGPRHPDTALAHFNRGVLFANTADDAAALVEFDEALAIRLETLGPAHPLVASTQGARALSLARLGKREASKAALASSLEVAANLPAPQRASALDTAGQAWLSQHQLAEAAEAFEQARTFRTEPGVGLAYDLVGLARVALEKNECAKAKPLLAQAASLRTTAAAPLRAEVGALEARCLAGTAKDEALAAAKATFARFPTARRLALDSVGE